MINKKIAKKDKKQTKKGKNQGITLIALIITIIVLLILTGVSIATLTGDNGILNQANKSKENTEIGKEKELIAISINSLVNSEYGKNELKEELIKNAQEENIDVLEDGEAFIIKYNSVNRNYRVENGKINGPIEIKVVEDVAPGDISKDKNGNALDGSNEQPYEINCIEDLVSMSGKAYSEKYIILKTDLNFKSDLSYVNGKIDGCNNIDELKEKMTTGNGFVPIGQLNNTTFDGNNQKIDSIYMVR